MRQCDCLCDNYIISFCAILWFRIIFNNCVFVWLRVGVLSICALIRLFSCSFPLTRPHSSCVCVLIRAHGTEPNDVGGIAFYSFYSFHLIKCKCVFAIIRSFCCFLCFMYISILLEAIRQRLERPLIIHLVDACYAFIHWVFERIRWNCALLFGADGAAIEPFFYEWVKNSRLTSLYRLFIIHIFR